MATISICIIRAYQFFLSPDTGILFPGRARVCRFFPSCSEYTVEVLKTKGFFRGWLYTARRISRCHPLAEGGYDPPPAEFETSNS